VSEANSCACNIYSLLSNSAGLQQLAGNIRTISESGCAAEEFAPPKSRQDLVALFRQSPFALSRSKLSTYIHEVHNQLADGCGPPFQTSLPLRGSRIEKILRIIIIYTEQRGRQLLVLARTAPRLPGGVFWFSFQPLTSDQPTSRSHRCPESHTIHKGS
jgi:hypothetical protein